VLATPTNGDSLPGGFTLTGSGRRGGEQMVAIRF
jgi:hypothetical protein